MGKKYLRIIREVNLMGNKKSFIPYFSVCLIKCLPEDFKGV